MASEIKLTLGLAVLMGMLAAVFAGPGGRIYLLQMGHEYGSHEYLDDEGYLSGFGIGLIDLVCGEAQIECRVVWDLYSNCWDSAPGQHPVGGRGLLGGWYDACTGWYTTIERIHTFQFSQPYLKTPPVHFIVLNGRSFNTAKNNIMNSKIVLFEDLASDAKCLARQTGATVLAANIISAKNTEDAISQLNNGYDVIFATLTPFKAAITEGRVKIVGPEYSCMLAGNGMMTRKDNDLIMHWNNGFNKLKNTGRFKKYCAKANAEHIAKGNLTCIDSF